MSITTDKTTRKVIESQSLLKEENYIISEHAEENRKMSGGWNTRLGCSVELKRQPLILK